MQKKIERGSNEWLFFQDYYKFREYYYIPENNDAWFEELVAQADKLIAKYKDTEIADYVQKMVLTHLEDVELRSKKVV